MQLKDIYTLLEKFEASSATGLELEMDSVRLKLEKTVTVVSAPVAAAAPLFPTAVAPVAPAAEGDVIKAPLVGTFYASAAPGKPAFVNLGDTVKQGQTVCVLEAMKMMSEVPAPADCVIEEVLVSDGELVGFDAPIFRVRML